jgi:long-chain acyl-CoA synthetase
LKPGDGLLESFDPAVTTMHDAFESTANILPANKCLGARPYDPQTKTYGPYEWIDYQTVQRRRKNLGAGLVYLHKELGVTGDKYGVGLWCQNRPEWQIVDLACMSQALFSVSLYDTLGPDAIEFIIRHASLNCVATSVNHVAALLKLKPRLPTLKVIVCLDPLSAGERPGESKGDILNALAAQAGVAIFDIHEVEDLGLQHPRPYNPPRPDDLITINYTSGTTGDPKGVLLTHRNAVAGTTSSFTVAQQHQEDIMLSYLPLAHIYQRVTEHAALWAGAGIGYFHGNILELPDDIKLLRPTGFTGVPRLYNRFYAGIREQTIEAPGIRGMLSRRAVETKLANANNPDPAKATNKHLLYDRIWAKKVAKALGLDRATVMVSGSAPIEPSLHQFLRIVFSNDFVQGYGLTESYAVSLCQLAGDMTVDNCGAVAPGTEVCIADVPEMEYLSSDKPHPRGELLLRGPTIFKGYFRNEKATASSFTEDGWFRTGDIASVDESTGRFRIIDRVKNVLKLAQGEYVSPERIENAYAANCSWIASAYVHGDSTQSFLVAIFGVAPEALAALASKVLGRAVTPQDVLSNKGGVLQDERVKVEIMKQLEEVAKKNRFNSYERVRAVELMIEPFTVENEILTPTLKLKRPQAAKRYRDVIDRLYADVLKTQKMTGFKAKL